MHPNPNTPESLSPTPAAIPAPVLAADGAPVRGAAEVCYQLAQVNIALAKAALDSAVMQGFTARLEEINRLADAAPGFVWRYESAPGEDAAARRLFGPDLMLVNISVWSDLPSLKGFVYRSAHAELLRQRGAWFERMGAVYQALWWLPAGQVPTLPEAKARLDTLQSQGPGPEAFTFAQAWPAPGAVGL